VAVGGWDREAKRRSLRNVLVRTRPTGGKKGRKHSLLVDGRGVPLSIAVSGANLHDSKLLDRTLAQVAIDTTQICRQFPNSWKTAKNE